MVEGVVEWVKFKDSVDGDKVYVCTITLSEQEDNIEIKKVVTQAHMQYTGDGSGFTFESDGRETLPEGQRIIKIIFT